MKLRWETKSVKVGECLKYDINPRKISDEKKAALKKSLKKFDLVEIPVVDFDMTVIAGNQKIDCLCAIGKHDEVIDVRYPNRPLTDLERKEYAVISNTHAGDFDFDILNESFSDIDFNSIGFSIPGFDVFKNKKDKEKKIEDDDVDISATKTTSINSGDVIEIGQHRLVCGSSTDPAVLSLLMQGAQASAMITDPPYNVAYTGKTKDALKIQNDSMKDGDFYQFLLDFYKNAYEHTASGGAWYVWHADSEGANFRNAMIKSGVDVRQCLIWVKNSMVMGRQDYQWKHEPCLYGWKGGASHRWFSDRAQTTVLEFDRPQRNAEHPTMKPVPLIAYLIQNSTATGDIVLDCFGGSGTTMVACEQTGRICRMVEVDPLYCQVIIDRMIKTNPALTFKVNDKEYAK